MSHSTELVFYFRKVYGNNIKASLKTLILRCSHYDNLWSNSYKTPEVCNIVVAPSNGFDLSPRGDVEMYSKQRCG